jgi:hypothetical protein
MEKEELLKADDEGKVQIVSLLLADCFPGQIRNSSLI